MSEWKTIESAPMDGEGILAMSSFRTSEFGTPAVMSVNFSRGCFRSCEDSFPFYDATHWMPLPEPPK